MTKSIAFLAFLFLTACSPTEVKMADDIIEGEAQVVEKVIQDVNPKAKLL